MNLTITTWLLPQYESPAADIDNHQIKYFFRRSMETRKNPKIDKTPSIHVGPLWDSIQLKKKKDNERGRPTRQRVYRDKTDNNKFIYLTEPNFMMA